MNSTTEEKNLAYAKTFARMIQCETITADPEKTKYYQFHDLLRELFPHLFDVLEVEDFDGSLLMRWPGKDSSLQPIMLMNHFDVVEASGEWSHAPFSGDISDGKLWGRGTLDNKGGLWGMLQAAEELAADGYVPDKDIWFETACTDESSGTGADSITKELKKRGIRFSMVLDEGGMTMYDPIGGADGKFAMIALGEKATVNLKFTAKSNGGHASAPGKDTPLVRLGKFMASVEANKTKLFPLEVYPAMQEMLKTLAPKMKAPLSTVFANAGAFAPVIKAALPSMSPTANALFGTTLAFTMSGGSEAPNVLPREAWVIANMRCSHHQGVKDSVARIQKFAKKFDIETSVVTKGFESPITDVQSEAYQKVAEAVRSVFPDVTPCPYLMTGASDNRFFSRVSDGCVRYVPFLIDQQQLSSIHGKDENVDISNLTPAVAFYKYLIQNA